MHSGVVRHILSPLIERLLGRTTFARLAELQTNQWWSSTQLREMQAAKLRVLLNAAQRHCPYYQKCFANAGVDLQGDPFEALAKLPLLDKPAIRRHLKEMTHRNVPGGPIPYNTGGSTGEPLSFYMDRGRIAADKAARALTHAWFDAKPGEREAYLWGSPVELHAQDHLKRLRDWLTNEKLFSAFNLSPASMSRYLHRLHAFDPVSIFGYPSSLCTFAEYCESTHQPYEGRSLRAVFPTGEVLDAEQRETLRRFFDVPVADCYGSRDGGFIAHECPAGRRHIFDQNLIVEIVDEHGCPSPPGEIGEIVLTHLDVFAMPLIRYRTGDTASLSLEGCPCGRGMRILNAIDGRRTDHLVGEDGALRHGLSAIYVVRKMKTVKRFRIHQSADLSLHVEIVPEAGFGPTDSEQIRSGLKKSLGESVCVRIEAVKDIKSQASGKFCQIISDAVDMGPLSSTCCPQREGAA